MAQETVPDIGRVRVKACDRASGGDNERAKGKCALAGSGPRARRIEDRDRAIPGANVTVSRSGRVEKEPGQRLTRINGVGARPLPGFRACAGRIEDCKVAAFGPDETVPHIIGVAAESDDRSRRGDVVGVGALKNIRARPRRVKDGNSLR